MISAMMVNSSGVRGSCNNVSLQDEYSNGKVNKAGLTLKTFLRFLYCFECMKLYADHTST